MPPLLMRALEEPSRAEVEGPRQRLEPLMRGLAAVEANEGRLRRQTRPPSARFGRGCARST